MGVGCIFEAVCVQLAHVSVQERAEMQSEEAAERLSAMMERVCASSGS